MLSTLSPFYPKNEYAKRISVTSPPSLATRTMPLDPTQLFPTFLNLLSLPDPRSWLASLLPSILSNVFYLSPTTSHHRRLTTTVSAEPLEPERSSPTEAPTGSKLGPDLDYSGDSNNHHKDVYSSPSAINANSIKNKKEISELATKDEEMTQIYDEESDSCMYLCSILFCSLALIRDTSG